MPEPAVLGAVCSLLGVLVGYAIGGAVARRTPTVQPIADTTPPTTTELRVRVPSDARAIRTALLMERCRVRRHHEPTPVASLGEAEQRFVCSACGLAWSEPREGR